MLLFLLERHFYFAVPDLLFSVLFLHFFVRFALGYFFSHFVCLLIIFFLLLLPYFFHLFSVSRPFFFLHFILYIAISFCSFYCYCCCCCFGNARNVDDGITIITIIKYIRRLVMLCVCGVVEYSKCSYVFRHYIIISVL